MLSLLMAVGLFSPTASTVLAQGIIYTSLPQPMEIFSSFFSVLYPIDVNGDGVVDFTFGAEAGFVGLRTERTNRVVIRPDPPPNIGGLVAKVEGGVQIGPSLTPQLVWISSDPVGGYVSPGEIAFATIAMNLSSGSLSEWPGSPGARGFIGIAFDLSDGTHYGYFDVIMAAEAGGSLLGWAYNSTPWLPVTTFGVPEPSVLTLFAMTGLGLLAMRRR